MKVAFVVMTACIIASIIVVFVHNPELFEDAADPRDEEINKLRETNKRLLQRCEMYMTRIEYLENIIENNKTKK